MKRTTIALFAAAAVMLTHQANAQTATNPNDGTSGTTADAQAEKVTWDGFDLSW